MEPLVAVIGAEGSIKLTVKELSFGKGGFFMSEEAKNAKCLFSEEHVRLIKENYDDWLKAAFGTMTGRWKANISPFRNSP